MDLNPKYNGNSLLIHYGSPLVTPSNTVIVPVKTGLNGGFRVDARNGGTGSSLWSLTTDYVLPSANWTPEFGPVLTVPPGSTAPRLYYPAIGGTVLYRDNPDAASGSQGRLAFYGIANYNADAAHYQHNVQINTPLSTDGNGNVFFGFVVSGSTQTALASGIARIGADGSGTWVSAAVASGDSAMLQVPHNCTPAISADGTKLYVAVSNGKAGYLLELNSSTLATVAKVRLKDPKSGQDALISNDASATPTIGPDGDVYYGVLENPFPENNDRGWLLHFNSSLSTSKTPSAFGWDDTASVVPISMVPSYTGTSSYLLMTKYNNYIGIGTGNGQNKIAIVDPNTTETDPITGVTVMKEVLTMLGPTPFAKGGVTEWCINMAAVDLATNSILLGSEDGKLYRWNLVANTLTQSVVLTPGIGEAYTPTVIGVDGTVYAINNATLFAVGN